jgi:RHS repeat-associated protein
MLFGRHIVELNATNNTLVRSYVWGLDLSRTMNGAGGVGGLLWVTLHTASGSASGTHFVCYDGNGNIVALVSAATGDVTARYEYGPFGEPIRVSGPAATLNPFRFSTKRTEPAADLVLYEYRAYSPSTGRWLNRDPIEESGGRNLYGFVGNNPLTRFDALGLLWPGYPDWPQRPPPSKPPKYPKGFALCQRNIQKDGSCDCPAIFANAIGGEHAYMQYVDDEGNKWGYGFGKPGTAPEKHFDPNSCKPCNKTGGTLKHGSGSGKAGSGATDDEIKDCIKNHPPSKDYKAWGKNRYNCKDWAKEAAANCGLDCN